MVPCSILLNQSDSMVKTKAIFQRLEQFTCFEFVFSLVPYDNNIILSNPLKAVVIALNIFQSLLF